MNKYEKVKSILRNGDICEFKTWDDKIIFGFYMDGYLYRNQENNVVCGMGGFEPNIIAIRRPDCMRNAFECFKYGSLYNYNYSKFGSFTTVYEEKINCNECEFINITEEEQIDKTKDHICLKHNMKIIHRSSNPNISHDYIYPCEQCDGKDFVTRC